MCKSCMKKKRPCGCQSKINGMARKKNNRLMSGLEIAGYGLIGNIIGRVAINLLPVSDELKYLAKGGLGVGTILFSGSDYGLYLGAGMLTASGNDFVEPIADDLFSGLGLGSGGSSTGARRINGTPMNKIHKVAGQPVYRQQGVTVQ